MNELIIAITKQAIKDYQKGIEIETAECWLTFILDNLNIKNVSEELKNIKKGVYNEKSTITIHNEKHREY